MAYISSQYGDGDVSTSVGGGGFSGGGSDVFDLFRRLAERRLALEEAPKKNVERLVSRPPTAAVQMRGGGGGEGVRQPDPLAAQKAADRYEMRQRSAAMRPTGLGAQMIPGMAVDPRLLPSRFQPSGSSLQVSPDEQLAAQRRHQEELAWSQRMAQSRERGY
jgi:hypothetical protein